MADSENRSAFYNTDLITFFITQAELLVRRRKSVSIIFFIIVLPVFIRLLFADPVYTAKITILPQQDKMSSNISALEGLPLGLLGANLSGSFDWSQLYEDIIRSNTISKEILYHKFQIESHENPIKLIDYFDLESETEPERVEYAKKLLDEMIVITRYKNTKTAMISVTTPDRNFSADLANLLAAKLNKYIRAVSSEKASDTREFIEGRLEITLDLLTQAEEILKKFRETNKRIENSPDLQLEQGRLVRELKIQEEIFLVLKKELETTKIEEVKNIPIVRVLDPAEPPAFKSGPLRRRILLVVMFLATFMSIGVAYVSEFWSIASQDNILMKRISTMIETLKKDYDNMKKWLSKKFKRGNN